MTYGEFKKGLNILSLFDGLSCGRVALDRAGIKVGKYYGSEIDKYAIAISRKNFPDIVQLGDINNWRDWDIDFSKIDLLFGGFCCQSWSVAGKQMGDKEPRGQLMWVMLEIRDHIQKLNPKVKYLFENVRMKKEFKDYIDKAIGTVGILIDSNLISAQNRKRLYWTNIPDITQPEDKGILLKDIVHENTWTDTEKSYCIDANYAKGGNPKQYYAKARRQQVYNIIKKYIVPFDKTLKILEKEVEKGKVGYFKKDSQANRVYFIHDKAVTLCGDAGGGAAKMGQYLFGHTKKNSQGNRVYREDEKSPTLNASSGGAAGKGNLLLGVVNKPRGNNKGGLRNNGEKSPTLSSNSWEHNNHLLFGCITPDRINKRQNGQRFSRGKKFYTLTAQDKHGILVEGYIRKLTPIECERLQTMEDNSTALGINENGEEVKISNSQRYKALGNGWTVDVISHILKNLKL